MISRRHFIFGDMTAPARAPVSAHYMGGAGIGVRERATFILATISAILSRAAVSFCAGAPPPPKPPPLLATKSAITPRVAFDFPRHKFLAFSCRPSPLAGFALRTLLIYMATIAFSSFSSATTANTFFALARALMKTCGELMMTPRDDYFHYLIYILRCLARMIACDTQQYFRAYYTHATPATISLASRHIGILCRHNSFTPC